MSKEKNTTWWQGVKKYLGFGDGNGLRSQTIAVRANEWNGNQGSGMFYFGALGNNDIDLYVAGDNSAWYWNAYRFCPTVSSIFNRRAEAFINGVTTIKTVSGPGKGKESNSEQAQRIRKLFTQPNPLQSFSQFEMQYHIYKDAYGYCPILPIKPVGMGPETTTAMWIIPPALVSIKESQKIWYNSGGKNLIESIILRYGQEETKLNWDDLIIIKDFTPSISSLIIPTSRLHAYRRPIEAVIKAYKAIDNGFDNTPLGVMGNDSKDSIGAIPLTDSEKQNLTWSLNQYGLGDGQKKIIISNANLRWQPINYPIASLMISEHLKVCNTAICDGLGYPYDLLARELGSTFTNRQEAGKELYQNFIIPESKSIYEQWNEWFKTDDLNLIIENDYSHLPILQQDELSKAQARLARNNALLVEFQNDLITVNRWLELNGEETRGPAGDVYYSQWIKANPEMLGPRYALPNVQQAPAQTPPKP